jgi:streptomycin 6-kinase
LAVRAVPKHPSTFQKNIIANFHAEGAAWLEQLGGLIRLYEERWSIQVGEPFLLSYSYCAPAVRADGTEVVLKLEVPNPESRHRAQALRCFNGHGMVRLLEADIERGVTLMERLKPGKMLADEITDDEEATRIAAGVMQAMWIPAPQEYCFPTLVDWQHDFANIHRHLRNGDCPLPKKTIERTESLFADLLSSAGEQVLLHGDLHHFNILSVAEGERIGWQAIDPFGVVGEREFDVGALMRNPLLDLPLGRRLKRILVRRFEILREMLGFDWQRMVAWASVYAAVSAWWSIAEGIEDWHLDGALADEFAKWIKSPPIFS